MNRRARAWIILLSLLSLTLLYELWIGRSWDEFVGVAGPGIAFAAALAIGVEINRWFRKREPLRAQVANVGEKKRVLPNEESGFSVNHYRKRASYVIVAVAAILIGLFIWPTMYRYDHARFGSSPSLLVRINRVTGSSAVLTPSGWHDLHAKAEPPDILPPSAFENRKSSAPGFFPDAK